MQRELPVTSVRLREDHLSACQTAVADFRYAAIADIGEDPTQWNELTKTERRASETKRRQVSWFQPTNSVDIYVVYGVLR